MKRAFVILIGLNVFFMPKTLLAQETDSKDPNEKSVLLSHMGLAGIWFPMPQARQMLKDLKKLEEFKALEPVRKARDDLRDERLKLTEEILAKSESVAHVWKETAESQAKMIQEAKKTPWILHPYLWATIGVIAGVGVTLLIIDAGK